MYKGRPERGSVVVDCHGIAAEVRGWREAHAGARGLREGLASRGNRAVFEMHRRRGAAQHPPRRAAPLSHQSRRELSGALSSRSLGQQLQQRGIVRELRHAVTIDVTSQRPRRQGARRRVVALDAQASGQLQSLRR